MKTVCAIPVVASATWQHSQVAATAAVTSTGSTFETDDGRRHLVHAFIENAVELFWVTALVAGQKNAATWSGPKPGDNTSVISELLSAGIVTH